jgi:holo-[acyl-carrier protein] synthase
MIVGVGIDILCFDTLPELVLQPQDSFFQRVYTKKEQELGFLRERPSLFFRGRFAAKEAVFKALNTHPDQLKQWNLIEILTEDTGAPSVCLHGSMAEIASQKGITKIHLSISNDAGYVTALCVAESE